MRPLAVWWPRGFRVLLQLTLIAFLFGFSQPSMALICKSMTDGAYLSEYIGPVSVPDTVPDGTIIWRSQTHVVPAKCFQEARYNFDDPIYFYGNPSRSDVTSWGIEFGLVYKQVTAWDGNWSSNPSQGVFTGFTSFNCFGNDLPTNTCTLVEPVIAFQVVIRKRGLLPLQRPTMDTYDVFQLDGKQGLNDGPTNPHGNFRYQLNGLQNIVGTACSVDVTVTPDPGIVDFGSVQKTSTGFSPPNPTKPFSLSMDKKCSTSITIGATLVTAYQQGEYNILPSSDSQFGIQVRDARGNLLPVNEPFPLTTFAPDVSHMDFAFTASLISLGSAQVGPFEAVVVVQIVYY